MRSKGGTMGESTCCCTCHCCITSVTLWSLRPQLRTPVLGTSRSRSSLLARVKSRQ
jgi:hypothetical protein